MTATSTAFFGHPGGLRTLFLTEMWERMSYYGMRALLVLYMTGAVTAANAGLGMSALEAQAVYGIYVGMVYFLAVPGGWLADNLLGHQRAVLYAGTPDLGGAHRIGSVFRAGLGCRWHGPAKKQHLHHRRQTVCGQ